MRKLATLVALGALTCACSSDQTANAGTQTGGSAGSAGSGAQSGNSSAGTGMGGASAGNAGIGSGGVSGGAGSGVAGVGGTGTSGAGAGGTGTSGTSGTSAGGTSAGGTSAGGTGAGGTGASGAGAGGTAGSTQGPAGPRFIGRFDDAGANASAPNFAWSGSAIELAFTGTDISITLAGSATIRYAVVLDGKQTEFVTNGGMETIALGSGLTNGAHDVLVYRQSEAFFWITTFHGFSVKPSAYLPSTIPARRLAVIGDSISAGYGMDGCPFSATNENHYNTAAAVAARQLGADLHTTAWSGIGMYRDSNGDTAATTEQMPQRFSSVLPDDSVKWDFSRYQPDAVLINLGTNDFAKGDPGAPFQTTYEQFVTDLRADYPNALFYLAVGPMLSGTNYNAARAYINQVISDRAAVDKKLKLLEFSPITSAEGFACDSHPTKATNARMAQTWVAALQADLGW
ncbi:MAG TPA: GDSL-type esterase/lipase family protein [Polyangiaceae bacterium]